MLIVAHFASTGHTYSWFCILHDYVSVQTLLLSVLMKKIGNKNTVLLGLVFQLFQLAWYGFGSEAWWESGTGCDGEWAVLWLVWVTVCLLLIGWCGRPVPSLPCPASLSQPWARWCLAARIRTSRVREHAHQYCTKSHSHSVYQCIYQNILKSWCIKILKG